MNQRNNEPQLTILRTCKFLGSRLRYTVKIHNQTRYAFSHITVTIVSYPEHDFRLEGDEFQRISLLRPGASNSLDYFFIPLFDHYQVRINAMVSYTDYKNELHSVILEPYEIRDVSDVLVPFQMTLEDYNHLVTDLHKEEIEYTLQRNPHEVFLAAKSVLTALNFYIVNDEEQTTETNYTGVIASLAKGKYTAKRVAMRILISGSLSKMETILLVEGSCDDRAILPFIIEGIVTELFEIIE